MRRTRRIESPSIERLCSESIQAAHCDLMPFVLFLPARQIAMIWHTITRNATSQIKTSIPLIIHSRSVAENCGALVFTEWKE